MLPTKHKFSDKDRASKAAKQGFEAVEDMFRHETFQYEAELKAEGLPTNLLPLEAAMALAKWEEAKPLHKLSPVSVLQVTSPFFVERYLLFTLPDTDHSSVLILHLTALSSALL